MNAQHPLDQVFAHERPRLRAIAYRMLASTADADDVLQDAWLRVSELDAGEIHNPPALFTTVVTRLCIDRLRALKPLREHYPGTWMPDPVLTPLSPLPDAPTERVSRAESITFAFLVVLERLSPLERAVFLLRDVFEYTFEEIAAVLERTPAACRQLHHRAREHLDAGRPRFEPAPEAREAMLTRFVHACAQGDMRGLESMLAHDVTVYSDGGGKASAARKPVHGRQNAARMLLGLTNKPGAHTDARASTVNNMPAMLLYDKEGQLRVVFSLDVRDERVHAIRFTLNPDKLHLDAGWD